MVRTRKERKAGSIPLAQPDRSGPSEATLLDLAQERNLFDEADRKQGKPRKRRVSQGGDADDEDEDEEAETEIPPAVERVMETMLWSVSLAMLHFAFDVLVQRQYAMQISWHQIVSRTLQAFVVFSILFYVLHPHQSSPNLVPRLPIKYQNPLRQAIFLVTSTYTGCYLIHITNEYGYFAILKRSPPLGCLWIWSVIELNLSLAMLSLAFTAGFFVQGGYTIQ